MLLLFIFQSSEKAGESSMKAFSIDSDYTTINTEILDFVHWSVWAPEAAAVVKYSGKMGSEQEVSLLS